MVTQNVASFSEYISSDSTAPLLIRGDAKDVLASFPPESIDMVITSPPYYMKREYLGGGIGLEDTYSEYIDDLVAICQQVYRVLKPTGSFWLNLGDSYQSKNLLMIPQRVAIRLTDEVGFVDDETVDYEDQSITGCVEHKLICRFNNSFHGFTSFLR